MIPALRNVLRNNTRRTVNWEAQPTEEPIPADVKTRAKLVAHSINSAFSGVPPPSDEGLRHPWCIGDSGVEAFKSPRWTDWHDIPTALIAGNFDALVSPQPQRVQVLLACLSYAIAFWLRQQYHLFYGAVSFAWVLFECRVCRTNAQLLRATHRRAETGGLGISGVYSGHCVGPGS